MQVPLAYVGLLRSVSLLSTLSHDQVLLLAQAGEVFELAPRAQLFAEGEQGDAVYVVIDGVIQIIGQGAGGEDIVLARLPAGELFGEHYLFAGASQRRAAGARAQGPTRLLRIPGEVFLTVLNQDAALAATISERRSRMSLENLARRSAIFREIHAAGPQQAGDQVVFEPGEVIFREGDEAGGAYLIINGEVEIFAESAPSSVITRLGAGSCFGERACIQDSPRSASARAATRVEALLISRERFVSLHRQSAALRNIVDGLEFLYRMPNRGVALLFSSRKAGEESVERLYRLDDGRQFRSTFLPGAGVFRLDAANDGGGESLIECRWQDEASDQGACERVIRLFPDGKIAGLQVLGEWVELPAVVGAVIDGVRFAKDTLERFKRTGSLGDAVAATDARDMACFCLQIESARILSLAAQGCKSFAQVQKKTGCGSVCGGCEPQIQSLLGNLTWVPVRASECMAQGEIRVFHLTPMGSARIEWQSGRHVVVSGKIGNHWVRRSYIITNPPGGDGVIEIAVRREATGVFSRWLFEGDLREKQLRVSQPAGAFTWQPNPLPLVCMVAGIGVTPAIAIARRAAGAGGGCRVHVDYSGHSEKQMVFFDELEAIARANLEITLTTRLIVRGERIADRDVQAVVAQHPDAQFLICGPAAYMRLVSAGLRAAGVADARIHEEVFVHDEASAEPAASPAEGQRASLLSRALSFLRGQGRD